MNLTYCIIIPCYNEGQRILTDEYLSFVASNNEYYLLFVDDGSTDNTIEKIQNLATLSNQISTLKLTKNKGKAEAIRTGMNYAMQQNNFDFYGYLDADLAIPFSELLRLKEKINNGFEFAFSSKKQTKDSLLEIKFKRYIVGRILSKMVKASLKLNIYDTQCGCKLMSNKVAQVIFKDLFISAWLFDVEIIWRIIKNFGNPFIAQKVIEVPLIRLLDRGSSRIKIMDLIYLPFEFIKIHLHYKKYHKSV